VVSGWLVGGGTGGGGRVVVIRWLAGGGTGGGGRVVVSRWLAGRGTEKKHYYYSSIFFSLEIIHIYKKILPLENKESKCV